MNSPYCSSFIKFDISSSEESSNLKSHPVKKIWLEKHTSAINYKCYTIIITGLIN